MKINIGSKNAVILTTALLIIITIDDTCQAINCYKCVSLNWQNKQCDDTFHANYTDEFYNSPCMGGRKGRNGLFPATACIKLTGVYDDTGDHVTVRGCALDSGTQTTDTEIIRMSHCGGFFFDDRYVRGCLHSCDDGDGCNQTSTLSSKNALFIWLTVIIGCYFIRRHNY